MIEEVASRIVVMKKGFPFRVGIDGIDAAGKTTIADEIASCLTDSGHPVLRTSIDGFHNPRRIRHQRGSYSPEGYYYDSFNYELLKRYLLEPLGPTGSRVCQLKGFDFKADTDVCVDELMATNTHILIFEGVFLFRHEIEHYWDLKILVDIDFETSIQRALERDLYLFGDQKEILKKYQERYIPGQKIYIQAEKPHEKADLVINNSDFANPILAMQRGRCKPNNE